jgi:hypothetical protein
MWGTGGRRGGRQRMGMDTIHGTSFSGLSKMYFLARVLMSHWTVMYVRCACLFQDGSCVTMCALLGCYAVLIDV